jgi:plastocyanin
MCTLATLSCGDDGTGPGGEQLVEVEDDRFDPITKTVDVGDRVLWDWTGSNSHNVTWVAAIPAGNSPTQTDGTYIRDFDAAGTFDYYCTVHGTPTSGMRGTILVE